MVEVETDDLPGSFEQELNDEEPLELANEAGAWELQAQPVEEFVKPYEEPNPEVIEQIKV